MNWNRVRNVDPFAVVEKLLTAASLALVALTVGGQLGPMLGLHGRPATIAAWSIALVYDALWIGALRMSELAIRQRSRLGMAVMLGLTAGAIGVSTFTLLVLGHARVFAGVPAAAAIFMGLRLFTSNVLADADTANRIADQSATARNARALAAAEARNMRSQAEIDVVAETAGHLAELARQTSRASTLTRAQKKILKARAGAEATLAEADTKYAAAAQAFAARDLQLTVSRPAVTAAGVTGVTQVRPQIETVTPPTATQDETDAESRVGQVPVEDGMSLADLALAASVDLPKKGVILSDEQIDVVLRWLRYDMQPPRSYRQAVEAFRRHGFQGGEHRIRRIWGEIETRENEAIPTP